jgi:hypothetical protein
MFGFQVGFPQASNKPGSQNIVAEGIAQMQSRPASRFVQ